MTVKISQTADVQRFFEEASGQLNERGDPRTKALVRRILDDTAKLIEEMQVTPDEFWKAVDYLNRLGSRQEAGLLAAGLGLEHYLDLLLDAQDAEAGLTGGTPRTIEGPLYVADAPRVVYLFSDPNCPYCTMFWEQARPWVDAGKVQLRHIMVGIIREDSEAKSAALLASKDPQKALHDHEQAGKASTLKPLAKIPAAVRKQLAGNMELMESMGAAATPAIFYLNAEGRMQQQQGAPQPDQLAEILGPR
ncbi:thiol:disulfide interchange protein DsbG [Pseudomonas aeruginosa]|nr:thiol:disulfide interchange protein DsbG [Pseudomonas aeruginosa]